MKKPTKQRIKTRKTITQWAKSEDACRILEVALRMAEDATLQLELDRRIRPEALWEPYIRHE